MYTQDIDQRTRVSGLKKREPRRIPTKQHTHNRKVRTPTTGAPTNQVSEAFAVFGDGGGALGRVGIGIGHVVFKAVHYGLHQTGARRHALLWVGYTTLPMLAQRMYTRGLVRHDEEWWCECRWVGGWMLVGELF
jgi:hypothetical protein